MRSPQVSGKSPAKAGNSNGYNNSRTNLRSPSSMVRCSSVGVLNRIDPAADSMPPPDSKKFGVGKGLMRPTISSQNKIATSGSKVQNSGLTKRRGTAFSSGKTQEKSGNTGKCRNSGYFGNFLCVFHSEPNQCWCQR